MYFFEPFCVEDEAIVKKCFTIGDLFGVSYAECANGTPLAITKAPPFVRPSVTKLYLLSRNT